jgi:hypothetical protein
MTLDLHQPKPASSKSKPSQVTKKKQQQQQRSWYEQVRAPRIIIGRREDTQLVCASSK